MVPIYNNYYDYHIILWWTTLWAQPLPSATYAMTHLLIINVIGMILCTVVAIYAVTLIRIRNSLYIAEYNNYTVFRTNRFISKPSLNCRFCEWKKKTVCERVKSNNNVKQPPPPSHRRWRPERPRPRRVIAAATAVQTYYRH
jgi:hypothetical protein